MSVVVNFSQEKINRNFEVSIVLPYYKKYEDFSLTIKTNAPFFERNGIEVIICMDDPQEEEQLILLIKEYPFINWKVLINRQPHSWRNPSKAINTGIRHACKDYVLVMGPDSAFHSDLILELRCMAELYPNSYFLGHVIFTDEKTVVNEDNLHEHLLLPYGSILARRKDLLAIRGYNEQYTTWGGDDDNIRTRLDLHGCKRVLVREALLIHREKNTRDGEAIRTERSQRISDAQYHDVFYPDKAVMNKKNWGTDFSECIYDYQHNKYARELCTGYLSAMAKHYTLMRPDAFESSYKIIALLPVFNERKHVPEVLEHLDKHCDGIILLDDASTDGTYEAAASDKLLLKVQKVRGAVFDDQQNRNMLLNIASFFQATWLLFLDADERFDPRWNLQLEHYTSKNIENVVFPLVHLWDDEGHFRTTGQYTPGLPKGVLLRWRMFKNKGRMQFLHLRKLHFTAVPYVSSKSRIAQTVIKHYGMISAPLRSQKYQFYQSEDEKWPYFQFEYQLLLEENSERASLESIDMKKIMRFAPKKSSRQ
ncbi:MAG: glycosyltransferase [Niastella sp.]|nr:glycosyltransferase [Niastella sp.]